MLNKINCQFTLDTASYPNICNSENERLTSEGVILPNNEPNYIFKT